MLSNEQIGRNVAFHRHAMSQVDLAAQMKARGWPWTQTTVSALERGERSLRMIEAPDLAEILGIELDHLIYDSPSYVARALLEVGRAEGELIQAARWYGQAQRLLLSEAEAAQERGDSIEARDLERVARALERSAIQVIESMSD